MKFYCCVIGRQIVYRQMVTVDIPALTIINVGFDRSATRVPAHCARLNRTSALIVNELDYCNGFEKEPSSYLPRSVLG